MARIPRMLVSGDRAIYHVMSHTALDGLPLGDAEKDYFVNLLKNKSQIYFTEILGFCCMGNHFHILVRMIPDKHYSDQDVQKRFELLYGKSRVFYDGLIPELREKWANLSEFMKDLKSEFSRYYNKKHERKGYFWRDRFKSVIVEEGQALMNCLAYIDLNPVRAGIVTRPEAYRWSSIGYHMQTGNRGSFLAKNWGFGEFGIEDGSGQLQRYRKFLYKIGALETDKGASIPQDVFKKEMGQEFSVSRINRFRYRTRYFSDSAIIGSKAFVQQTYQRFKHHFSSKNEKIPKPVSGLDGIYSLKKLIE